MPGRANSKPLHTLLPWVSHSKPLGHLVINAKQFQNERENVGCWVLETYKTSKLYLRTKTLPLNNCHVC